MPEAPGCLVGLFCWRSEIPRRGGRFVKEFTLRRFRSMLCGAIAVLSASATPSRAQSAPALSTATPVYREVTDEAGRTVRIPQPVRRIVSLAPSLTETVYALGLQDHLVGDTDYCDYPPDAQKKTKVGGGINPSFEEIAALHPDLVLVTKGFNRLETVHALEGLGISSYATDPHTVDEIMTSTKKLADILGVPEAGVSVAEDMQRHLVDLQQRIGALPAKHVLFVVWTQPLISVGKRTFIADALRFAGAVSIIDSEQDWPQVNLEEVARLQPEFLVFAASHSETVPREIEVLATLPSWQTLDAITNRRYAVISDAVNRPAPRIVSAIEELARQLHPDAFAEKPENLSEKTSKEKLEREKSEKDKNERATPPPIHPPHSRFSFLSEALHYNVAIPGGCTCAR
jgi:iron complex transport system substrate-binding protein